MRWRTNQGDVRACAARVLGRYGPIASDAVPALIVALEDGSTRGAAVNALVRIGPEARAAIPALEELTGSTDTGLASLAVNALGRIGPEARAAIPALEELTGSTDTGLASLARFALMKIDPKGHPIEESEKVPAFTAVLADEDFRMEAAAALGEIGPDARAATPQLLKLLEDRSGEVRAAAARALGRIKPDAEQLLKLLEDRSGEVRAAAARALGRIKPAAEDVVPILIDSLRYRGASLAIAQALERIDPEANGLRKLVTEDLNTFQQSPDKVLRTLLKKLKDPELRLAATYCLRTFGPGIAKHLSSELLQELEDLQRDPDDFVRDWATKTWKRIQPSDED